MKHFDIVCMGEILIDFSPDGRTDDSYVRYIRNPGGAVVNVASVFAKYGAQAGFVGKVGEDLFGRYLHGYFSALGIDCSGIVFDRDFNTTLAFVSLDEKGNRDFAFYRRNEADLKLRPDELKTEMLSDTKLFHFGSLSMTAEPARSATLRAVELASASGAVISYDPNYRDSLWAGQDAASYMLDVLPYVDLLKVSAEEGEMMTGISDPAACAEALTGMGPSFAAVTVGADGAYYSSALCGVGYVPAYPAKTIDTTGAGDTFFGTFLYEYAVKGLDLSDPAAVRAAVEKAVKAAGLSTEKKGAAPSIPFYEQL